MSAAEVCASCGFGPGERTGRLCRYDVPDRPAFGDWRGRRGVLLCDDCVRQAPGVLHPVVEAPEEPPERILAGLTEHATMVRAATDDCTCVPGEGCDAEGDPGCRYCQTIDPEWPCPAEGEL